MLFLLLYQIEQYAITPSGLEEVHPVTLIAATDETEAYIKASGFTYDSSEVVTPTFTFIEEYAICEIDLRFPNTEIQQTFLQEIERFSYDISIHPQAISTAQHRTSITFYIPIESVPDFTSLLDERVIACLDKFLK